MKLTGLARETSLSGKNAVHETTKLCQATFAKRPTFTFRTTSLSYTCICSMESKSISLLIWPADLLTERVLIKEMSKMCRCTTFRLKWTSNLVFSQAEIPYMATMKNCHRCPICDGVTAANAPPTTPPPSAIFFISESKKLSMNVSSSILNLPYGI